MEPNEADRKNTSGKSKSEQQENKTPGKPNTNRTEQGSPSPFNENEVILVKPNENGKMMSQDNLPGVAEDRKSTGNTEGSWERTSHKSNIKESKEKEGGGSSEEDEFQRTGRSEEIGGNEGTQKTAKSKSDFEENSADRKIEKESDSKALPVSENDENEGNQDQTDVVEQEKTADLPAKRGLRMQGSLREDNIHIVNESNQVPDLPDQEPEAAKERVIAVLQKRGSGSGSDLKDNSNEVSKRPKIVRSVSRVSTFKEENIKHQNETFTSPTPKDLDHKKDQNSKSNLSANQKNSSEQKPNTEFSSSHQTLIRQDFLHLVRKTLKALTLKKNLEKKEQNRKDTREEQEEVPPTNSSNESKPEEAMAPVLEPGIQSKKSLQMSKSSKHSENNGNTINGVETERSGVEKNFSHYSMRSGSRNSSILNLREDIIPYSKNNNVNSQDKKIEQANMNIMARNTVDNLNISKSNDCLI